MALTTAAVVSAVAATAATGMGAAQQAGAFDSGGSGTAGTKIYRTPEDPQDRAIKDYSYRMAMQNVDKTYPSFMDFLKGGGQSEDAKFDLTVPEMTPEEAAALHFTGGRGEAIPYMSPEDIASGRMSPTQRMYLARTRARDAWARGQKPGAWASRGENAWGRIHRFERKANELEALPDTQQRQNRIERLREKRTNTMGRWNLGEGDV